MVGLDVFMALNVLWLAVAIYHDHGSSRMVFILNQSVTLFGAYFFGRVLVRNAADHRLVFRCMLGSSSSSCRSRSSSSPPRSLIDLALGKRWTGGGAGGLRLGFRRVSTVFPHPILFGLFCSIMIANFFYVFYADPRAALKTGLAMAMTFMALSSGPTWRG